MLNVEKLQYILHFLNRNKSNIFNTCLQMEIPKTTSSSSSSSASDKKSKGRTGWPQHVWALELKQQLLMQVDCTLSLLHFYPESHGMAVVESDELQSQSLLSLWTSRPLTYQRMLDAVLFVQQFLSNPLCCSKTQRNEQLHLVCLVGVEDNLKCITPPHSIINGTVCCSVLSIFFFFFL